MHGPSPAAFDSADWVPSSYLISVKSMRAVGQVARQVIARLARFDFTETEDLLIELGGLLEIFDFQREMDDAVHVNTLRRAN